MCGVKNSHLWLCCIDLKHVFVHNKSNSVTGLLFKHGPYIYPQCKALLTKSYLTLRGAVCHSGEEMQSQNFNSYDIKEVIISGVCHT